MQENSPNRPTSQAFSDLHRRLSFLHEDFLQAPSPSSVAGPTDFDDVDMDFEGKAKGELVQACNEAFQLLDNLTLDTDEKIEATAVMNNGLLIFILIDHIAFSSPSDPILQELSINVWKRFIKILKLYHSYMSTELIERIMLKFDRYIMNGLASVTSPNTRDHLLDADIISEGHLNTAFTHIMFFAQKISASLAYFLDQMTETVTQQGLATLLCCHGVVRMYHFKSSELGSQTKNILSRSLDYLQKALVIPLPSEECNIEYYDYHATAAEARGLHPP